MRIFIEKDFVKYLSRKLETMVSMNRAVQIKSKREWKESKKNGWKLFLKETTEIGVLDIYGKIDGYLANILGISESDPLYLNQAIDLNDARNQSKALEILINKGANIRTMQA